MPRGFQVGSEAHRREARLLGVRGRDGSLGVQLAWPWCKHGASWGTRCSIQSLGEAAGVSGAESLGSGWMGFSGNGGAGKPTQGGVVPPF